MLNFSTLTLSKLKAMCDMPAIPSNGELKSYLKKAIHSLESEPAGYRPLDKAGRPGSLLYFTDNLPTVIVPDLHARADFLLAVLRMTISSSLLPESKGPYHGLVKPQMRVTVFEALQKKQIRVICLGDALHAESRQRDRWLRAYAGYLQGQKVNASMVGEMREGLSLIIMICALKSAFPEHFHFLKGNHENILNQVSNGNHSFKKFASEGEMVLEFMKQVYGTGTLQMYDTFEKSLPLFVQTPWYLASHAEPSRIFTRSEIINAYQEQDVVFGLTWTANDQADPQNVPTMLKDLVPDNPHALWFAGHRPVLEGKYCLRADDKFVQLHNPAEMNVAIIPGKPQPFNFSTQIISVSQWAPSKEEVNR